MNYLARLSAEVMSNPQSNESARMVFFSIGGSLALLGCGAVVYGMGRGAAAIADRFVQRRHDSVGQLTAQDDLVDVDYLTGSDFEEAAQQWSDIVAVAGILEAHRAASNDQPETEIFMCKGVE